MTVWYHLSTFFYGQRSMRILCLGLLCVVFTTMLFFVAPASAAPSSETINFSARLKNKTGGIVADGNYNIRFNFYTAAEGGSPVWTETYHDANGSTAGQDNRVRISNGYLSIKLGSLVPFTAIDWEGDLWMTMDIGGTSQTANIESIGWDGEMTPRIQLSAVPYAMNTKNIGGKSADQLAQLGQGIQTDASDVASIAIDKTGSGDLLHLQSSGVDAFRLQNNGNITLGSIANQSISVAKSSSGSGKSLTLLAGGSATGSNQQGGNLILQGGSGDGSTAGGDVVVTSSGTNSLKAFAVQNTAGEDVFSVSTTDTSISIGSVKISSGSEGEGTTVSLWSNTTPSVYSSFSEGDPLNLGLIFRSTQPGSVTGVKFFNPGGANTNGNDIGKLWSCTTTDCSDAGGSTGTELATVTFSADATLGWKQATFSEPVAITPNMHYMISYYSAEGVYAASSLYFEAQSAINAPLVAPGFNFDNGRFRPNSSDFPAATWHQTNYWVDVMFKPTVDTDHIASDSNLIISSAGDMTIGPINRTLTLQGSTIELQADSLRLGKSGSTTTVDGSLNTDTIDAASVGTLVIGGDNATAINIEKDTTFGGSVTMRNEINSAAALQVQDADGTEILTVNTDDNRIQIGKSDATATVLILDTKTSSGDPTGVNGAMYYNSSLNKFRCFEENAWKDCITPLPVSKVANADTTHDTTTPSDVSGLSFDLAANTKYYYKFVILHEADEDTTGIGFGVTTPDSPLMSNWCVNTAATLASATSGHWGAYCGVADAAATTSGVENQGTIFTSTMEGYIQTDSLGGTLQLRMKSETATKEVTVKSGSFGILQIVQ